MEQTVTPNEKISTMLGEHIAGGDFSSAVYLVSENSRVEMADALGAAVREPEQHPATLETIYDLASLTKPLVTGLLAAALVEGGALAVDELVAHYLAEFNRPGKDLITVRQLLTHTSGLQAWRPLYIVTGGRIEKTLDVIADAPLAAAPGTRVIYSDLGFITLGLLIERITDEPLAVRARREIFQPLTLRRTFFNPDLAARTGIAACEGGGNAYERSLCESEADMPPYANWRTGPVWGEVHDGNAHFMGGSAGHAGLFSTAPEVLRLADQFIAGRTQLLAPSTCALFRTNMTAGLNEVRSFAWQLAATTDSTAGPALAPDSFGHLGFTGTSCWVDAARGRVFILLTNRTHARPLPFANINGVRRQFHTLAAAALERKSERREKPNE